MKRLLWLDNKKNEIVDLYYNGLTQTEIANRLGVSQGSITTRLRKWKLSNPDGNRYKRIFIERDELYDLYWNRQMHPSQIAVLYGCHKQVITNNLIKYSIPRRSKRQARFGFLNSNWKGGVCAERYLLYSNKEWKEISILIRARDNYTCQRCFKKIRPLHIHHKVLFSSNSLLRLDPTNLILLCKKCHNWVHSRKNIDKLFLEE